MYRNLAVKITNLFVKYQILKREDSDIYYYSFELLFATIISSFFIFLIAILFGQVFETIVFFLGFFICRKLSGGFHAKNHIECFFATQIIFLGFNLIAKYHNHRYVLIASIIIIVFANIFIFIFAPVDDANKPFDEKEKVKYKKNSRNFALIAASFVFLVYKFSVINEVYFYFVCGIFAVALLLVFGYIKNKFIERRENYE